MKLPVSMLRDFVETPLSAPEIGELLTMAGFELEGIEGEGEGAVLDIKVVANRGDGLSALGLAREVLAKDKTAKPTELYGFCSEMRGASGEAGAKIRRETELCRGYAYRVLENAQNGPSPQWLAERLEAAGMRPISLLVDLSNYVMLEIGQPLHAFDLDALGTDEIVVRLAKPGEKLTTLDGVDRELDERDIVIATPERAAALAGVIGGRDTECTSSTKRVLLESAHFDPLSVRKTRKRHNIATDASYRFERSVDPEGAVRAILRFGCHYMEAVGADSMEAAGWTTRTQESREAAEQAQMLEFDPTLATLRLGMEVNAEECARYLSALGFEVQHGTPMKVAVPSFRPDIVRQEDLIEEVGRIHGYDRIPETPMRGLATRGTVPGIPGLIDLARKAMLRSGFHQIMSHSLRDRHPLDFHPSWQVRVRNPHSPELAVLRDSLLPGLADAALRNGARDLHLFEIGNVFVHGELGQFDESAEVSFLSTGHLAPPHWTGSDSTVADFFSAKGVVEELAGTLGDSIQFDLPRHPDPRFHPTRQAGVLLDSGKLWAGTVGQVHPDIAAELGLPEETYLGELDLLVFEIQDNAEIIPREISRNPAIRRDIAIAVPKSLTYAEIERAIRGAAGLDLEKMWLFDVYTGKGVDEGSQSLAIALQFRRVGANLNDSEANALRDAAIEAVKPLGATLR